MQMMTRDQSWGGRGGQGKERTRPLDVNFWFIDFVSAPWVFSLERKITDHHWLRGSESGLPVVILRYYQCPINYPANLPDHGMTFELSSTSSSSSPHPAPLNRAVFVVVGSCSEEDYDEGALRKKKRTEVPISIATSVFSPPQRQAHFNLFVTVNFTVVYLAWYWWRSPSSRPISVRWSQDEKRNSADLMKTPR